MNVAFRRSQMESQPGSSGVRFCQSCDRYKNHFAGNACTDCWLWFEENIDLYFHKDRKLICPSVNVLKRPCMLSSCVQCLLRKILENTGFVISPSAKRCKSCCRRTVWSELKCSKCLRESRIHKQLPDSGTQKSKMKHLPRGELAEEDDSNMKLKDLIPKERIVPNMEVVVLPSTPPRPRICLNAIPTAARKKALQQLHSGCFVKMKSLYYPFDDEHPQKKASCAKEAKRRSRQLSQAEEETTSEQNCDTRSKEADDSRKQCEPISSSLPLDVVGSTSGSLTSPVRVEESSRSPSKVPIVVHRLPEPKIILERICATQRDICSPNRSHKSTGALDDTSSLLEKYEECKRKCSKLEQQNSELLSRVAELENLVAELQNANAAPQSSNTRTRNSNHQM